MKDLAAKIIISLTLFLIGISDAGAQYSVDRHSFDTDINHICQSHIPHFDYSYDDYLQYAPVALTYGLKALGYESRSSWTRMFVSDVFSVAAMAATVNGIKYTVSRPRPDGSQNNSFPSGHTATAFMTATMLHKEYGHRSPWFSIGGYTAAAITGVSRIMNNKHWMTDVMTGAAIGIGSVHLGYLITDLIFKDKGLLYSSESPAFTYDSSVAHYSADMLFGQRFIIGAEGLKEMDQLPISGGTAGLSTDIPIGVGQGVTARLSASSMTYASGKNDPMFSMLIGGFWNYPFARILEFQAHAMAGYAWMGNDRLRGADLAAGISLGIISGSNFKFKIFGDFESMNAKAMQSWMNTFVVGWTSGWFW